MDDTTEDIFDPTNSEKEVYDFIERFEFVDGTPGKSIIQYQLTTPSAEWTPRELWEDRDVRFGQAYFTQKVPGKGKRYC
jgi:hypothetical protein